MHRSPAQLVAVLFGIVFLLVGPAGFVPGITQDVAELRVADLASDANFVPVNAADNWLHLGLGVAMVALGVLTWSGRRRI